MSLFSRASKPVTAHVHDWIDVWERPEKIAKQALRDLSGAIDSAATATARSIAAERLLGRRREELMRKVEEYRRTAAAAATSDESAARSALSRQFEAPQSLAEIERQLTEAAAVNTTLRSQLELLRSRQRQAQDRVTLQAARRVTATAIGHVGAGAGVLTASTATLHVLDQACDRTERSILEAEALNELCGVSGDGVDEARESEEARRRRYVEDELLRLRQPIAAAASN